MPRTRSSLGMMKYHDSISDYNRKVESRKKKLDQLLSIVSVLRDIKKENDENAKLLKELDEYRKRSNKE